MSGPSQDRDRPPHGREGGGAGDDRPATLLGVEAGEELGPVYGAGGVVGGEVEEGDGAAAVETAHQRDLAPAERAAAVEPDGDAGATLVIPGGAQRRPGASVRDRALNVVPDDGFAASGMTSLIIRHPADIGRCPLRPAAEPT